MRSDSTFHLLGAGFGFDSFSIFWWRGGREDSWQNFFPVERERVSLFPCF